MEAVTDHLPGAVKVPAIHNDGDRRDLRLDACRGLALSFIFIDHIPGNSLAWLTLRNYGFSDTTEVFVFVFVSGYTCMLAYGGALREQGWPTTVTRALRRGWEIYAAFLLLLIAYFVLIWVLGGGSRYLDETNTGLFFENPGTALVHAAILQYTPANTDILPTFVLLHLAFPIVLWLLIRSATVTLAISLLLYLMVQMFNWHVPAWPTGELYFNPLAWQILFVFGAWYADEGARRIKTIVQSRAALVLVALSLVQPRHRLELGDQSARRAYTRCDRKADLPHLQKPPCALAPAAFSRASHLSLAADAARLARPDEALDDGDDSLRRKLADDLLPGRFTVVYGFRNPVQIFELHRHADYYQHCRYRPHDRRSDSDNLDFQA